jgi:hypothetical protein
VMSTPAVELIWTKNAVFTVCHMYYLLPLPL